VLLEFKPPIHPPLVGILDPTRISPALEVAPHAAVHDLWLRAWWRPPASCAMAASGTTFFDRMDFSDGSREHNCRPLREGNENTDGVPPLLQRGMLLSRAAYPSVSQIRKGHLLEIAL
jgi:hypothetical protein